MSPLSFADNPRSKKITIVSGGTAANSLVSTFSELSPHISYILPISDNGGSTSELIRVVGGPAIGDLRSRITRLIPDESTALRSLLSYRLPDDAVAAKAEWAEFVEGTHPLWYYVQSQCKELIRPFFIHVHVELLKRSRPGREFRFEQANVGNLFLTGARLFCGSLDPAIELFLRITLVPSTLAVLPALNTNFSHHISAQLENGTVITGQSQISHPSNHLTPVKDTHLMHAHLSSSKCTAEDLLKIRLQNMGLNNSTSASTSSMSSMNSLPTTSQSHSQILRQDSSSYLRNATAPPPTLSISTSNDVYGSASDLSSLNTNTPSSPDNDEDAYLPFSHPDLKISQLHFSKGPTTPLASPIRRVFYINPYGQEIHPRASTRVIRTLEESDVLVYSIGSLFTSTIPIVILQGFATAIQDTIHIRKKKILLLNGTKDRETEVLSCLSFVRALIGACLYSELGSKSNIYYNHNFSSSSISVNLMAKQQQTHHHNHGSSSLNPQQQLHAESLVSNYTTTSSHPQDILMRPTPRIAKTYSTGIASDSDNRWDPSLGTTSHDALSSHEDNSNPGLGPAASTPWVATDSDIDDVYNIEKINKSDWSKYITHIVYLNESQLCPAAAELEELRERGIKCYGISAVMKDVNVPIYGPDQLCQLLSKIIHE